jgi:ribosomal protein L40E
MGEHEASRRLKSELLMQIDGLCSGRAQDAVVVLATTNKPWDLDEAMRRRLERRIYVPLPDEAARREMLGIHLEGVRMATDVSLSEMASRLEGYSGADVQLVCRDASLMPMRRAIEGKAAEEIVELQAAGALDGVVTMADFHLATLQTLPSTSAAEHAAYARWNDEHGCKPDGRERGAEHPSHRPLGSPTGDCAHGQALLCSRHDSGSTQGSTSSGTSTETSSIASDYYTDVEPECEEGTGRRFEAGVMPMAKPELLVQRTVKYCMECGAKLPVVAKFCCGCGRRQTWNEPLLPSNQSMVRS